MRISGAVVIAGAILAATMPAAADEIPPCARPAGVGERSFPADLPTGLKAALQDRFGEIVSPGGKFDSTDVVATGQNRRAIFVWQRGQRWIVATEHGGIGYNDPVLAFEVALDGSTARLLAEKIAIPPSVCKTAIDLLEAP